jgi:hypothetical protein
MGLCNRRADGRMFINSNLSLVICRRCLQLIDPKHEHVFIPWIREADKEEVENKDKQKRSESE